MHRVDVVIRTKDRPLFLARALRSISAQTMPDWGITVVNDGGDPAVVRAVVEEAGTADRTTIVDHDTPRGRWPSANAGVRAGSADFLVLHDDDDAWHPEFLERSLALLDVRPDLPAVAARTEIVFERQLGQEFVEIGRELFEPGLTAPMLLTDLLLTNRVVPIALLYRRSVHAELGDYREDLPVVGDWEFNLRLARRCQVPFVDGPPLAYWHQRPDARGSAGNSVFAAHDLHRATDALVRDAALRDHADRHDIGDLLYLTSFVDSRVRDLEVQIDRIGAAVDRAPQPDHELAEVRDQLRQVLTLLEAQRKPTAAARVRRVVGGRLPAPAVRALRGATRPHRVVVFRTPASSSDHADLHADLRARGGALVEVGRAEHLAGVLSDVRRPPGVLHVHGSGPVPQQELVDRAVDSFRAAGGTVVRTTHAVAAAPGVVSIPHPVTPRPPVDREAARRRFGLHPAERALLWCGPIDDDAGALAAALELLAERSAAPTLLVAGEARGDVDPWLERLRTAGVRVVADLRALAEHEVDAWFAAADLVLAPRDEAVAWGLVHRVAAHDRPILLTGLPTLRATLADEPWVRSAGGEDLGPALAQDTTWAAAAGTAATFARDRHPDAVARRTTELLLGADRRILPRTARS